MNFSVRYLSIAFFFSALLMSGCGSDDPSAQPNPGGTVQTTAQLSLNSCDSIHYHGRLEKAKALDATNYFSAKVNVSAKGTYSFKTAEANGYYFLAEGEFTTTGIQELRFNGKGTPLAAAVDNVTLEFGNAICGQKLTVYEQNFPNPDATVIIATGEPFMGSSYYTYAFNGYGKQLWHIQGSSTPAISGETAFTISNDEVYAISMTTGATIWKTSMGLSLQEGPVTINGNNLYVAGNGKLMSIATSTGAVNWTYTISSTTNYVMWAPAVSNDKVFVAYQNNLHCIDLAGNLVWTYTLSNSIRSNPAVSNGVVYVGNDGGTLTAINISDKTTKCTYDIGMTGEESPTIDNGKVYVQGSTKVFCLDAATGTSIWTYSIASGTAYWSSPTVANGKVYVAGFGKGVIALDAASGQELWHNTAAAETADNPPTVLHSLLVEGGANGLAAINAITGATVWNYAPFVAGGSVTPVTFYTPAAIYNRETGEIAYPSTSGQKQ